MKEISEDYKRFYSDVKSAITIELVDNVPGIVVEPLEIPERIIPDDWDI